MSGVAFDDHTVYAKGAQPGDGTGGTSTDPSDVIGAPCLTLGIAPYQPFDPPLTVSVGEYVIHDPLGYRDNGQLWLERAMRLAARSAGCPSKVDGGLRRRSLQLELEYWDPVAGATKTSTLASDLTDKSHPVPLPTRIAWTPATLTITEREQTCGLIGCSAPSVRTVRTAILSVRQTGSYGLAGADYSATVFDLDDDDQTSFRTATITGVQGGVEAGVPVSVEAEGYRVTNGVPSVQPVLVKQGQPFAIYNHDFFSDDPEAYLLYPATDAVGVDHAAGLRWPRIVGSRNGHPFRYSVQLPTIVRDAVDFCSPDRHDTLAHSFYRLPWQPGFGHVVTQGNNGALTHQGNQRYAFDFDLDDGETIHAARGGTVTYVRESLWKNSTPGSGNWEPANALRIEHQDGTVSWYFHMQQWGVIPELGDRIHHGDPVGITGNTGNSTGPHLHYQVNLYASTKASIPIRFHVQDVLGIQTPCYVPQQDNFLFSDNA